MRNDMQSEARLLAVSLKEVVGGVAHLVAQHLALARAELQGNAKALARASAMLALMLIPAFVAYVLAMVALALVLRARLGMAGGFGLVAAANAAFGAIGMWWGVSKLRSVDVADRTSAELVQSLNLLTGHVSPSVHGGERHVA